MKHRSEAETCHAKHDGTTQAMLRILLYARESADHVGTDGPDKICQEYGSNGTTDTCLGQPCLKANLLDFVHEVGECNDNSAGEANAHVGNQTEKNSSGAGSHINEKRAAFAARPIYLLFNRSLSRTASCL